MVETRWIESDSDVYCGICSQSLPVNLLNIRVVSLQESINQCTIESNGPCQAVRLGKICFHQVHCTQILCPSFMFNCSCHVYIFLLFCCLVNVSTAVHDSPSEIFFQPTCIRVYTVPHFLFFSGLATLWFLESGGAHLVTYDIYFVQIV